MGVPTFFRWVSEKYPKIVQKCVEEEATTYADGTEMPIDATQPNPNGMEFDNLYLDMNGIIHPCTHPEDGSGPLSMEDMFAAIGKHIDRLFRIIRPRKLMYMAIDGIAPRAKMNQQRSRRFRAALEQEEARADKEKVKKSMKNQGLSLPKESEHAGFDSNVITPGTEFMDKLAEYLRFFIIERQTNDQAWAACKVILSDAQSPGEGEHKIMQFVRRQRAEKGHDANCHHVMYGLDADLIMLGLASHEVRFTVLRDQVFFGKQNRNAGAKKDSVLGPTAANEEELGDVKASGALSVAKLKPVEMLQVWILREYLQHEFRPDSFDTPLPFPYDFEKCIDDFVFLCFFVGNDFLPHLPSLSIREGGLELLLNVYRKVLPTLEGFITEDGDLHLARVDALMKVLGSVEDRIFQMRRAQEEREKNRKKQVKDAQSNNGRGRGQQDDAADSSKAGKGRTSTRVDMTTLPPSHVDEKDLTSLGGQSKKRAKMTMPDQAEAVVPPPAPPSAVDNKSAAEAIKAKLKEGLKAAVQAVVVPQPPVAPELVREEEEEELGVGGASTLKSTSAPAATSIPEPEVDVEGDVAEDDEDEEEAFEESVSFDDRLKRLQAKRSAVSDEEVQDLVKFGENGWKDRYYESKFGKEFGQDVAFRRKIVESYVKGLCWVLQYYYKGCQSWKWFFEFHYAPFASDLTDLASINIEWQASRPFKPFEQLMAVLPPQSQTALPEPCRWYMSDEDSEIADFYPRTIQFDPNGKPVRWLWIALLPFIDENRLLEVTKRIEDKLNLDEKRRNAMMPDLLFVPKDSVGATNILSVLGKSPPQLLPNWESDQIAILKQQRESKLFGDALKLPAPTTAGDVRGGGKDELYLSALEGGGISGFFIPAPPEFAVRMNDKVKSPFPGVIETVDSSNAFVCEFRLPPMLPHLSRLCDGVQPPPKVLTDQDLQIRKPRMSGMDVSTLVPTSNASGLDRSWGSAEPQRKNYQNPFLSAPPSYPPPAPVPGLGGRPDNGYYNQAAAQYYPQQQQPGGYGGGGYSYQQQQGYGYAQQSQYITQQPATQYGQQQQYDRPRDGRYSQQQQQQPVLAPQQAQVLQQLERNLQQNRQSYEQRPPNPYPAAAVQSWGYQQYPQQGYPANYGYPTHYQGYGHESAPGVDPRQQQPYDRDGRGGGYAPRDSHRPSSNGNGNHGGGYHQGGGGGYRSNERR